LAFRRIRQHEGQAQAARVLLDRAILAELGIGETEEAEHVVVQASLRLARALVVVEEIGHGEAEVLRDYTSHANVATRRRHGQDIQQQIVEGDAWWPVHETRHSPLAVAPYVAGQPEESGQPRAGGVAAALLPAIERERRQDPVRLTPHADGGQRPAP